MSPTGRAMPIKPDGHHGSGRQLPHAREGEYQDRRRDRDDRGQSHRAQHEGGLRLDLVGEGERYDVDLLALAGFSLRLRGLFRRGPHVAQLVDGAPSRLGVGHALGRELGDACHQTGPQLFLEVLGIRRHGDASEGVVKQPVQLGFVGGHDRLSFVFEQRW